MNEFDDIKQDEIVTPEGEDTQEPAIVVDDANPTDDIEPVEPVVTEPAVEEKTETEEVVEPVTEEKADEKTEEIIESEEKKEDEAVADEPETKTEEKVEEKVEDVVSAEPEESIEEIKAKIAEERAIIAEEKSIVEFERQARTDEQELAKFEAAVSDALAKSFEDLGVDVSKSIEEIRKEDPEKAFRVQQLILQAQTTHQAFIDKQTADAKARLEEIVFNRASRLFEKFGLSEDEAPIVAETFVNIINEVGLKNLDSDLVAKVELAVGRAKLLVPKVAKAVEQVKDIAKDVKDTVTDLMTPAPEVTPEEIAAIEEVKVETPKADLSEFKEGVSNTSVEAARTGKSLLEEMASISNPKERVEFYKENFKAIEEALRAEGNK